MDPLNYQTDLSEIQRNNNTKDFEQGLSAHAAEKKLREDGPNKLESQQTPKWLIFLRQFNNMVIYILLAAVVLTVALQEYSDAVIIAIVVIINTLIGYFQETSASNAVEKIKEMLSTDATVYRDGRRIDIPAEKIVVGDYVYLEAGDNVPADLRIVVADNLSIQESALTGEADSVEKIEEAIPEDNVALADQKNMAFASTAVTNGSGIGIVVATGNATEIGKISDEVSAVKTRKTPLMQVIDKLGTGVSYVILIAAVVIFIIGFMFDIYSLPVLAMAVISVVVGTIPEGLPATTSVILAKGVSDMAKNQNTIIKTLPSVETLGSVDVIATDKTGTLTKNEMTVTDLIFADKTYQVSGTGYEPVGEITQDGQKVDLDRQLDLFVQAGYYANDTVLTHEDNKWNINGEPTDGAFLSLYNKVYPVGTKDHYQKVDILPFDSDYRYMGQLVKKDDQQTLFVKGSPDKLFAMFKTLDESFDIPKWTQTVEDYSRQGKRVIAVGYREVDGNVDDVTHDLIKTGLHFLGLAAIIDPPREEVIQALKEIRSASVEVKMITGDSAATATAIGEKLGLANEIHAITGPEWDQLSDEDKVLAANRNQVFARTTPGNKIEIIKALQQDNKVTAMTGDGVNDAPALKRADIGIAMGIKGTDVAKDSADMILTDDNFATISKAIKEGRRIFDNIKKSILYLLPISFAEGLIIAFAILARDDIPLHPTQLLWINMVSATTIQFALIFEPAEKGIMKRAPRKTGSGLMNKSDVNQVIYISILMAIIGMIVDEWFTRAGVSAAVTSTTMINVLIVGKIFYLFNIRTKNYAMSKEMLVNKKSYIFIALMMILQLILTYVPFMQSVFHTAAIGWFEWLVALVGGVAVFLIAEFAKWIGFKRAGRVRG
ncbi:HAD-IC family P-type ATPase [Companilactobacillus zhongbaensis]|uniref:HAD-IC family P-type ATPase n=1 Tax=Companilactobacillus zhongbaensis TaxID=2486009 RepID=UPI000F7B8F79|nr:HAD-IC family P-type ATPase [Companilactobacillus zhongbaensis]